jgi:hypothetical protein
MGKDNNRAPDFKIRIPYIPEDEKEVNPSYEKLPSVKLFIDATWNAIDNPTIQVQPILYWGTPVFFPSGSKFSALYKKGNQ